MFFSKMNFSKTSLSFGFPTTRFFATASTPTNIPTIEELRRKHMAAKNVAEFKKTIANPDRIIGRAYAELEEERRFFIRTPLLNFNILG